MVHLGPIKKITFLTVTIVYLSCTVLVWLEVLVSFYLKYWRGRFRRLLLLSSDATFLFAVSPLQTNGFLFVLSEWQCQILRLTFDDTLRCTLHSPPLFRTAAPEYITPVVPPRRQDAHLVSAKHTSSARRRHHVSSKASVCDEWEDGEGEAEEDWGERGKDI